MQRGFKSYAEDLAIQIRKEMAIPVHGRLCAFKLADFLGVPTLPFSKLTDGAKALGVTDKQLKALEAEVHGLCIPLGTGRAILYNDNNLPARQQSDVAHEASHVLLRHPLTDLMSVGERSRELEAEAAHLSGALLLPLPAALRILRERMPMDVAATEYGISAKMVTYRCNASGARVIHRRGTAK
jgi:Zn-dependent peptidase ImmA (M78 family)